MPLIFTFIGIMLCFLPKAYVIGLPIAVVGVLIFVAQRIEQDRQRDLRAFEAELRDKHLGKTDHSDKRELTQVLVAGAALCGMMILIFVIATA